MKTTLFTCKVKKYKLFSFDHVKRVSYHFKAQKLLKKRISLKFLSHINTTMHTPRTYHLLLQVCKALRYCSSVDHLNSEEVVRGWRRWVTGSCLRGLAASTLVCAEEFLVASLVGVSFPQHPSQLTL